jgi:hypothetical protein
LSWRAFGRATKIRIRKLSLRFPTDRSKLGPPEINLGHRSSAGSPQAHPGHGHFRDLSRLANACRADLDNLASTMSQSGSLRSTKPSKFGAWLKALFKSSISSGLRLSFALSRPQLEASSALTARNSVHGRTTEGLPLHELLRLVAWIGRQRWPPARAIGLQMSFGDCAGRPP